MADDLPAAGEPLNIKLEAESIQAIGAATAAAVAAAATASTTAALEKHVATVSVKAPPFFQTSPDAWFAILDAAFATSRVVVSSTKFDHAVQRLQVEQVKQISDLIAGKDYDLLKERLISLYGLSTDDRYMRYWSEDSMGDRTPRELFIHLITLVAPLAITREEVLRRWKSLLPSTLRSLLQVLPATTSESALLSTADDLYKIEKTTKQLQSAAVTKPNPKKQSASRRPKPSTQTRESKSSSSSQLCWYHVKFGDNAKKCATGCQHKASGNARQ